MFLDGGQNCPPLTTRKIKNIGFTEVKLERIRLNNWTIEPFV